MARKPRLEFAGAIYHVISRGNYRKEVFLGGSADAFEKCLFEACERCGWKLHAYVIMSNHYHLALQTPEPNLVDGMKWLQGTFGNRFNAFHGERGHVFQSRYKSLLIEEGKHLLGVVNYIHLNPVRAGLVPISSLLNYRWSSYPKFFRKKLTESLIRSGFLSELGFSDSPSGMKAYARHLEWCEERDAARRDELEGKYCRGWAIAGEQYRKKIDLMFQENTVEAPGRDYAELKEAAWGKALAEQLSKEGKSLEDAADTPKSATWKIRTAAVLRRKTTATNRWIARQLGMGHPSRVRNLIRENSKLWD